MSRTVLVIEDHPLVRTGMRCVLAKLDIETLEAATVEDAIKVLANDRCDLVVYDWHLRRANGNAGGGGMYGLVAICESAPGIPVVVVSADDDDAVRYTSLRVGARGYLSKSADEADFARAVTKLLPHDSRDPCSSASAPATANAMLVPSQEALTPSNESDLTDRQQEVLQLLSRGNPNKWIARTMGLAEPTVRAHISAILKALSAKNRTEAVIKATEAGLVGLPTRDGPSG